jgi:ribosomal RNA-processing protein 1
MWMCDRPIPQQNLANDLTNLLLTSVDRSGAAAWLRAFWSTMAKQWTGIDVLRMEKFLLLVRRVFGATLKWMEKQKFEGGAVDEMLGVLGEWPLDPEGDMVKVPLGLRLHILDLWVDELERAKYLEDNEENAAARGVARRLGDMVQAQTSKFPSKQVRKRAMESCTDERLPWVKQDKEGEGEYEDTWDGIED